MAQLAEIRRRALSTCGAAGGVKKEGLQHVRRSWRTGLALIKEAPDPFVLYTANTALLL